MENKKNKQKDVKVDDSTETPILPNTESIDTVTPMSKEEEEEFRKGIREDLTSLKR